MILKFLLCAILVNYACGETCDTHQACIKAELCGPDGKVKTDGSGLIARSGSSAIKNCGVNLVCCQFKEPTQKNNIVDLKCGVRSPATGPRFRNDENDEKVGGDLKSRLMVDPKDDQEEQDADLGEFPWMILVLKRSSEMVYKKLCGGSLIRANVVLSSAHNVKDVLADDLMVRAGDYNILENNELEKSEELQVKSIIRHANFDAVSAANDVSLLFLVESFTLTSHINIICLPPQGTSFDGQTCLVSGWGKSKFGLDGIDHNILKRINLPMIPFARCDRMLKQTRLGDTFNLEKSVVCAGGELNKDACTGDGGSPLICPIPGTTSDLYNQYYQAGIVSWGIECGKANVPGVYTNVAMFSNWIDIKIESF